MTQERSRFIRILAFLAVLESSGIQAQEALVAKIDAIMQAPIAAGTVAGASVAVVKGSESIVMKGYGFADLELDVPTPPRATYEIASVTKQFTAASILLLAEQGKLALDDEITKFFPAYPTQGNRITIRHLLNHTSGIKSFTSIPEFIEFESYAGVPESRSAPVAKKSRQELVRVFSGKPFDFKPGEEQLYNNSGFFLAGLIIEKVSGKSYANFVQEQLFDRVGMKDSYYCSEETIRKNHAHGYDTDPNGRLIHKAYVDHRWPYAAGSLCSTAADMVAWNRALHGGALLKPESYREMTSPGTLNDGTKLRYGLGMYLGDINGRRAISHGGGANGFGFMSESEYYPDDDLVVVVLMNTAGPITPWALGARIAEAVLGKVPDRATPLPDDLTQFAGKYTGRGRPEGVVVAVAGGGLTLAGIGPAGSSSERLTYQGNDTFTFGDVLVTFMRESGTVSKMQVDGYGAHYVLARR